jgi:hypothetical protein
VCFIRVCDSCSRSACTIRVIRVIRGFRVIRGIRVIRGEERQAKTLAILY